MLECIPLFSVLCRCTVLYIFSVCIITCKMRLKWKSKLLSSITSELLVETQFGVGSEMVKGIA